MIDTIVVAGWVAGWAAAGRSRRLPPAQSNVDVSVSVVVPARNEASRLPALLAALARDDAGTAAHEVIVVDDQSTDGTGRIADAAGATVVRPGPPPFGWRGKPWACREGALASGGEVLVFLDADTEPAPGFVHRLAAAAAQSGGLVSVQPWHRVERLYERASAVGSVVALMAGTGPHLVPLSVPARMWRRPVGFGPAMAVPRSSYLATGGHALVRDEVVEDIALAVALADRGLPVAAYADGGERSIVYRMYQEGPAALIDGWTRNLAAGAGRTPVLRAALVGLWVAGAGGAALAIRSAPLAYVGFVIQFAVLFRRAGRFGVLTAAAYPCLLAAFVALFVRSAAYRVGRRPLRWRGRLLAAGARRTGDGSDTGVAR